MLDTSDPELVRRTRTGEVQAFGGLVQRYQQSVFGVCYRLLGERTEAEDLTQEAFIRAFQRLERFDLARPFGPWMRRLAANLCLNHLQLRRRDQAPLDDELDVAPGAAPMGDPVAMLEAAQQSDAIRAALLALPHHYRAVVELRHYQELSYAEIAQTLDLPVSDVKSHLFRARRLLAERLAASQTNP
jgi:RNA polymerase sigma-70 factor (ECF subfamily)